MRNKRTTPRSGVARRTRLIAVASGLVAVGAIAIPSANAQDPAPAQTFSATQLTAAGNAVRAADVAGTAWRVDSKSHTLVVTADRTVSQAEIAKIERAAGSNADAVRIDRTRAPSASSSPAATPSTPPAGAARWASTSAAAAPTTS